MKELNLVGEHWRENLQGFTFDSRIERAVQAKHTKEVRELGRRGIFESVFVASLDPKTRKILAAGFNEPLDLILDNFGTWFAGLIRTPVAADTTVSLTDVTPAAVTICTMSKQTTATFNYINGVIGTQLQLGGSDTAPARANTNITTPLGTAPENARFGTGSGSYSAGVISFSGTVTAGGAGTVKESGFFGAWGNTASAIKYIMLFHDLISPTVTYVAGNVLTCSYAVNI